MKSAGGSPPIRVRRSRIHGTGVFAAAAIRKGARIMEYAGERVSHAEAERRYRDRDPHDNHTFLFTVDARTVIDAAVGGNPSRFINHGCAPNCETVIEAKRIYIEALRDIGRGEELSYDYRIGRDADDPPDIDTVYGCRCGADRCRGTMLVPPKQTRRRALAAVGRRRRP